MSTFDVSRDPAGNSDCKLAYAHLARDRFWDEDRRGERPGFGLRLGWLPSPAVVFTVLLASASASAMTDKELTSVLQPYVERHELAGVVTIVASKDKVLSLEAVGYSDVTARKPMRTDALFWIASMSKPFTAAALMMLVDEGKVHLGDPVEKYLPTFTPRIMSVTNDGAHVRLEKPEHAVTVRALLSHTSGIPFRSSIETPTLDVFPLALRTQSYALEPLEFEPGSDFSYSNAGINTAARIIEVVSAMSFEDFLEKRLFAPLGMKNTTFWPTSAQVDQLAKTYKANAAGTDLEETPIDQLHYPLTDHTVRYPMPAGGLFSTAGDLASFCQMILNGGVADGRRLLSVAAIQEMTRNQLSGGALKEITRKRRSPTDPDGYGLGWFTSGRGVVYHPGADSTDMRIDLNHGVAAVWLVQHASFPGEGVKSKAAFDQSVAKRFMTTSSASK
jgi:CubicO group peptidase (beta-lactamase class C family)